MIPDDTIQVQGRDIFGCHAFIHDVYQISGTECTLPKVGIHAAFQSTLVLPCIFVSRYDDDIDPVTHFPVDCFDDPPARHSWKTEIDEDDVDIVLIEEAFCFAPGTGRVIVVPALYDVLEIGPEMLLILYDEYGPLFLRLNPH
ncbi:MAG: hypothetical protein AMS17_14100 [Spirochaetes bacterium DG_61]|nr:MAG: hypothetical protein AMS17_14100 [Spirochaetes bacterium DG_61]